MKGTKWRKAVGQSSLVRIDWKSFDDEIPKSGDNILVVYKFVDGYAPIHAEFLDYADSDIDAMKKFKEVRFREAFLGPIFLGSSQAKRLIAWGKLKPVIELTKECSVCKMLQCQC